MLPLDLSVHERIFGRNALGYSSLYTEAGTSLLRWQKHTIDMQINDAEISNIKNNYMVLYTCIWLILIQLCSQIAF